MLFDDRYKTIKATAEAVFRDRGSKFIAYAYPITTEDEVKAHILNLKSQHPKARHYCWALRLSPDRSVFRLNDDGEPSGTAGRPILNTLLSQDITNILVVVVRYFGGTLLGVPGLINAYKTATQLVLASAEIIELNLNDHYEAVFPYLQMNDVMHIIKDHKLKINRQILENDCKVEIEIPQSQVNALVLKLEKVCDLKLTYLRTL